MHFETVGQRRPLLKYKSKPTIAMCVGQLVVVRKLSGAFFHGCCPPQHLLQPANGIGSSDGSGQLEAGSKSAPAEAVCERDFTNSHLL